VAAQGRGTGGGDFSTVSIFLEQYQARFKLFDGLGVIITRREGEIGYMNNTFTRRISSVDDGLK
jgi:hypothetical protein